MNQESVFILTDGDGVSDEIMATQGLKQGCVLGPLLLFSRTTCTSY